MGKFLDSLEVIQQSDGIHWGLASDFRYQDDSLGLITVPKGFLTDGGSVPPFVQGFINPYGKGFRAFVIHDYLYATQTHQRHDCDECLKRALRDCGENWFDANVQADAVEEGGEAAWLEDQKIYHLGGQK